MNLRDVLVAAGVEPAELERALYQSRRLVRRVEAGSRVAGAALRHVAERRPEGSTGRALALLGSEWLDGFSEQTGAMLRPRGKR